MTTEEAHHTNVFVVLAYGDSPFVREVYGPFRSLTSGKDWGIAHEKNFAVAEIMRPIGIEDVAFVLEDPNREPTLEDQGIHENQSQIGDYIDDYIDPNIGR